MRKEAIIDVFAPAGRVVDDLMLAAFDPTDFNLPRPTTPVRIMNYARQNTRPKEPTSLKETMTGVRSHLHINYSSSY